MDLISIIEHYRRFFLDNFFFEDGRSSVDGSLPGSSNERTLISIVDPFEAGRNLCSACSSCYRDVSIIFQLKSIFLKGLQELSEFLLPLLDDPDAVSTTSSLEGSVPHSEQEVRSVQHGLMTKVFQLTNVLLRYREAGRTTAFSPLPPHLRSVFSFLSVDISRSFDSNHFRSTLLDIENTIFRAVQLVSKQVYY